ncbi:MAG TPA: hypothetical protein VK435_10895 [Thermodesulfovibrionales bacterium]|nr:hypothetical protein [Thermodesulfovibrionales bacterium]
MSMKSLARNATMLNIILLICALFFAFYVFLPTLDVTAKYVLPSVKKRVTEKVETGAENKIPSIAEYSKISEENLFHPERKIPVEKKSEQQQPLQRPEFILYGTLITDNLKLAYIEDTKAPKTSPGRGKRQTALKKGDTMSGYTVKEIDPDQVIMARGDDTIVLKVLGNAKKERSVQTTPQAAQPPRATPPPPPAKPRNIPQRRAAPFVPK